MTKTFAMVVSLALIVTVAVSPVWAVGDKVRGEKAAGPAGTTGGGEAEPNRGTTVGPNDQSLGVLTDEEIGHITYIREEEKLARDVYLTIYEQFIDNCDIDPILVQVFDNISESEQRHMDAVKRLIDKYELEDPVKDNPVGVFTDKKLQELYDGLVARVVNDSLCDNYCEALQVGIEIEITDIADLDSALMLEIKEDVARVFNNLLSGSYNHLNAFTSQAFAIECSAIP